MTLVRYETRPAAPAAVSETELAAKARRGDPDAFSELAARFRPRVYARALGILGNETAAEDACQETFLQAYRDVRTLRQPEAFAGWLLAIAANVCRQQLRGQRAVMVELLPEAVPDLRDDLDASDLRTDLSSLIRELSPQMSLLAELHYLKGLDQEDIAATLSMPLGTVSGTLTRARQELQSRLERMRRGESARMRESLSVNTQGVLATRCPFCARHRLEWRILSLPRGFTRYETFCPDCSRDLSSGVTQFNLRGRPRAEYDDGFHFAIHRVLLSVARRAFKGVAPCFVCSGRMVDVPSFVSRLAIHPRQGRTMWRCVDCGYWADNSVSGLLMGQPAVRRFCRELGAVMVELHDERIRARGSNCWRVSYRSIHGHARLTVVAEASSFDIVSVTTDYGRRTIPVS